ncbi:alanine racemase [Puniceicoccaceae bacterium K14]|nr:alanine racemase [Puniceicoccaceae bacterium K14]
MTFSNAHSRLPERCWAEIDLAALERNLMAIKNTLPPHIRYIAVVKADAYGHGIHQTVARLMHAGIDMFAVANISEAATIREIGSGWPILILSPILEEEQDFVFDYDIIPTISSLDEIKRFGETARKRNHPLPIHLKIDTGMGRVGVWHEQAQGLINAISDEKYLDLQGVYTHFSSAENDLSFTDLQRNRFLDTIGNISPAAGKNLLIHADNSSGINSFSDGNSFNAVRVGLLQFGVTPYPKSMLGRALVEPTFSFKTRIGLIKDLPTGVSISYGGTHKLNRPSKIAILCSGYGDGIPRSLSNRGFALIQGERCPILGNVTMDQTIVDVTDLKNPAKIGDEACFIGKQGDKAIRLEEFSEAANTIPWEILCSITKRVPRIYKTSFATS